MFVPKYVLLLMLFKSCSGYFLNNSFENIDSPKNFINNLETLLKVENNGISKDCSKQVDGYIKGLKSGELWAMKMLDSASKIPSGMLEGNIVDFGYFQECLDVEGVIAKSENVMGKYCLGSFPIDFLSVLSTNQTVNKQNSSKKAGYLPNLQLATCFPAKCSAKDLEVVYKSMLHFNSVKFEDSLCQTKDSTNIHLDIGSIATLSFFGVVLYVMLASTIYDVVNHYLNKKPSKPILLSFSLFTNIRKIVTLNDSPNQINCLHGIRVISTLWIILGHRYFLILNSSFPMQNPSMLSDWFQTIGNMFILEATIAVDTFFLMSGLVASYIFMFSTMQKVKFNILAYYFHRYLRLTPALMVVLLVDLTLLKYLGSGPLWPQLIKGPEYACEKNWWKTLLYIQNFINEDRCISQSWYLAVDMQLFLLSPFLLYGLKRKPKVVLWFTGFLTICSICACFLSSWFLEIGPSQPQGSNYMLFFYLAPWTRAAPWFIGFILGYKLYKIKENKSKITINKGVVFALWCCALAILPTCLFGGHSIYTGQYNKLPTALYMSLMRPSWAIAISWVILACATGYGGPIDWFLSLPLFQVLSKFTYTLYLVHCTVILAVIAQMDTIPFISNGYVFFMFWGDFAISFASAFLLTLAFESPIIGITKSLFRRR